MNEADEKLRSLVLSVGEGGQLPTEQNLAVQWGVSRASLRKCLAEYEARGVIVRKRRTGTVVAPGAAEALKTRIFIGRKRIEEMADEPRRLLKNRITRQLEDELAGAASSYRLVGHEYVSDPIQLRTWGRPTVSGCGANALPNIASYSLCEDLTERIKSWGELPFLWPNLWESVTLDGRVRGIPAGAHVFLLFGNRHRMRACGLDPDAPPRTWDELTAAALRLTAAGAGQYGLALAEDRHLAWGFADFFYQAGGKPPATHGSAQFPTFLQPACVKALTYLKELRWKHNVLMPHAGDSGNVARAFFEGRAAMCIMECEDMFNRIHQQGWGEGEVGVWPLPAGPDGHDLCHVSVHSAFINAYASEPEKDAAYAHLTALHSRSQVLRSSRTLWQNGFVTGWPSIYRDVTPQETGVGLPPAWFRTAQGCVARALPEPRGPGWKADLHLQPILHRILEDEHADPQRELTRAAASVPPPGLALN